MQQRSFQVDAPTIALGKGSAATASACAIPRTNLPIALYLFLLLARLERWDSRVHPTPAVDTDFANLTNAFAFLVTQGQIAASKANVLMPAMATACATRGSAFALLGSQENYAKL